MRTIWSCLISDQGWQYVAIGENAQPANALSDRWRPSVDGSKIKGVVSHSTRAKGFLLIFSAARVEILIKLYPIENKLTYQWSVAPARFACCNSQ
jgi:hypothetical protein